MSPFWGNLEKRGGGEYFPNVGNVFLQRSACGYPPSKRVGCPPLKPNIQPRDPINAMQSMVMLNFHSKVLLHKFITLPLIDSGCLRLVPTSLEFILRK